MKHQIVHTLQKYLFNPPIKLALGMGAPIPGYALLETTGRKTGKTRRTPVGNGRIGNQFWLVAEHGSRRGWRIAPTYARAVVPAGAGGLRDLGLEQQLLITRRVASGLENHGRTSLTRAVEVQCASADIDCLSNPRRHFAGIPRPPNLLVGKASQKRQHEQNQKHVGDSSNPLSRVPVLLM